VMLPGEWADVQMGIPLSGVLAALLETAGQEHWAILTAENPGSKQLEASENSRRRQALEKHLNEQGYRHLPTKHLSANADWPVERGQFVFGLTDDIALELAKSWGQAAVVVGRLASKVTQQVELCPHLAWVSLPLSA
jgi:Protein of unknown function (DUF3293)